MNTNMRLATLLILAAALIGAPACKEATEDGHDHSHDAGHGHDHSHDDHDHGNEDHGDHDHADEEQGEHDHDHGDETTNQNMIAIPETVRANLGLTFVRAEVRRVEETIRIPGYFEYLPSARQEYRTMLPGRIEVLVNPLDLVEAGTVLYRVDSPDWRDVQRSIVESGLAIRRHNAVLETLPALWDAHAKHEESLIESVAVWERRAEQLESVASAGGGGTGKLAEVRSSLAAARADLAEVLERDAELEALKHETETELKAAEQRHEYQLQTAAAILGLEGIIDSTMEPDALLPDWASASRIDVVASRAGVVESLGVTNGSWADETTHVMTLVQPDKLWLKAIGVQSDSIALSDAMEVRIVPQSAPRGVQSEHVQDSIAGTIRMGLAGNASTRTVDLFILPSETRPWARPGFGALAEIVTQTSGEARLAVPLAAVQQDGLTPVVFRRSSENADIAERIDVVLGASDGRWVAVESGIEEGDEIVLDGAYQLYLASSQTTQRGGHFHSDGTFHQGEDE